jgi:hypothetical protein
MSEEELDKAAKDVEDATAEVEGHSVEEGEAEDDYTDQNFGCTVVN